MYKLLVLAKSFPELTLSELSELSEYNISRFNSDLMKRLDTILKLNHRGYKFSEDDVAIIEKWFANHTDRTLRYEYDVTLIKICAGQ